MCALLHGVRHWQSCLTVRLHGTRSTSTNTSTNTSTTSWYRVLDTNYAQKQTDRYNIPIVLVFCTLPVYRIPQLQPVFTLFRQSNVLTV